MSTDSSAGDQPSNPDATIAVDLNQAITKYKRFYQSLSGSLKVLFNFCNWHIVPSPDGVELVIECASGNVRSQLMRNLLAISTRLNRRFGPSKIRILGDCYPFETSTEQIISYYRCWESHGNENSK